MARYEDDYYYCACASGVRGKNCGDIGDHDYRNTEPTLKKQPTSISAVFEQESQQDKIIGFYWIFFLDKKYTV